MHNKMFKTQKLLFCINCILRCLWKHLINPKKTGLFWRLVRLGGEILAVDRAIAAKICTMVVCDVIYKTIYLDLKEKVFFYIY